MDWRIREADTGDVEALALVSAATFLETFAGVLDGAAVIAHCRTEHGAPAYRRYFGAGALAWLAETGIGGAPIGFALLAATDLPGSNPDGDIELKRIYALSRFHGSGLGTALMRQVVLTARQQADRLLLGVYAGNARALAFYGKHGFARIADRRFSVGDQEYDDIVLAKPLA